MDKKVVYSDEQLLELRENYELPPEDEGSPVQRAVDRIDEMRAEVRGYIDRDIQDIAKFKEKTINGIEGSGYGPHFGESLLRALSNQISENERLNKERADVLSGAKAPDEYLEQRSYRTTIDDMVKEIVQKMVEKKIGRL